MKFRPCIDLHGGKVKQIVGSTYRDGFAGAMVTNYETDISPRDFASRYCRDNLSGGHVIMLGPGNENAALDALSGFPGGMQVGGGITPVTAMRYLDAGASHVIVTSYVFRDGIIDWDNLALMVEAVGKTRLVLDLSCVAVGSDYAIVTDRWQRVSHEYLGKALFERLSLFCDEFLVHAAHVEGRQAGIDSGLVKLLAGRVELPVTYAGGIRTLEDLAEIERVGDGRIDGTVGSALDIFGGRLPYGDVVLWHKERNQP